MKILLLIFILFFTACSKEDKSKLSQKECLKNGFSYKVSKTLNYRNGTYELKSKCYKKT